jgi:hypothetical protein
MNPCGVIGTRSIVNPIQEIRRGGKISALPIKG